MKRLLAAIALTCVFSSVASAGLIPTVDIAPPQPPPSATSTGDVPSVGGEVPNVGSSLSSSAVDLIQTFISLLSV